MHYFSALFHLYLKPAPHIYTALFDLWMKWLDGTSKSPLSIHISLSYYHLYNNSYAHSVDHLNCIACSLLYDKT